MPPVPATAPASPCVPMAAGFSASGNDRCWGVPVLREAGLKLAAAFRRDRLASSALEFALTLPLLLAITGGLVDIGLLWHARGEVALAINAGAESAQVAGASATPTTVQAAMSAATALTGMTVVATGPTAYCVTTSGSAVSLTAKTFGTACGDGTTASYYMLLTANYTYTPILPYFDTIAPTALTGNATVRLF